MAGSASLVELVGRIEDPRLERTRRHRLVDILALAVLAVIAGAEGWEDMEDFRHARIGWLRPFLRLENGTPSHDTIARVFRMLRPELLDEAIGVWLQSLGSEQGWNIVAIDGKTVRGWFERRTAKKALHLVSA